MVYSPIMEILRHLQNFWDSPENYSEEADKFVRSLSNQEAVRSSENKHGISADPFSYNKKLRAMVEPLAIVSGLLIGYGFLARDWNIAGIGGAVAILSFAYTYTQESPPPTQESIKSPDGLRWY